MLQVPRGVVTTYKSNHWMKDHVENILASCEEYTRSNPFVNLVFSHQPVFHAPNIPKNTTIHSPKMFFPLPEEQEEEVQRLLLSGFRIQYDPIQLRLDVIGVTVLKWRFLQEVLRSMAQNAGSVVDWPSILVVTIPQRCRSQVKFRSHLGLILGFWSGADDAVEQVLLLCVIDSNEAHPFCQMTELQFDGFCPSDSQGQVLEEFGLIQQKVEHYRKHILGRWLGTRQHELMQMRERMASSSVFSFFQVYCLLLLKLVWQISVLWYGPLEAHERWSPPEAI